VFHDRGVKGLGALCHMPSASRIMQAIEEFAEVEQSFPGQDIVVGEKMASFDIRPENPGGSQRKNASALTTPFRFQSCVLPRARTVLRTGRILTSHPLQRAGIVCGEPLGPRILFGIKGVVKTKSGDGPEMFSGLP
jgi:hypothetical protein